MRSARLTPFIGITLAAIVAGSTLAACGSSTAVGTPSPTTRPKLVLAAATAGTADAAAGPEPAMYPTSPPSYVLDNPLPDLGPTAGVRRLIAHAVSADDVAHLASALGMQGTPRTADSGFVLRDGDAFLTVTTTGGVTTVDYSSTAGDGSTASGSSGSSEPSSGTAASPPIPGAAAPDAPDAPSAAPADDTPVSELPVAKPVPLPSGPLPTTPPPVDVPSEADAANIAQTLLDQLGVLAGSDWTHTVDSGDIAITCAPNANCASVPSSVSARTVTFQLAINGSEVPGVGWSVTTGEHAQVLAVNGTWVSAGEPVDYPLRSTAQSFADVKRGEPQYAGPRPAAGSSASAAEPAIDDIGTAPDAKRPAAIHITGVALGLARWDGVDGDTPVVYVVPIYRFHARVADSSTYDIDVLALDPASIELRANVASAG